MGILRDNRFTDQPTEGVFTRKGLWSYEVTAKSEH